MRDALGRKAEDRIEDRASVEVEVRSQKFLVRSNPKKKTEKIQKIHMY